MKITKLPNEYDMAYCQASKIRVEAMHCPYCNTYSRIEDTEYASLSIKNKIHWKKIGFNFKENDRWEAAKDKHICKKCGAEWSSDIYVWRSRPYCNDKIYDKTMEDAISEQKGFRVGQINIIGDRHYRYNGINWEEI